jgi:peroxiredoxin
VSLPPARRSPLTELRNLLELPADLPVPVDDGACAHLPGRQVPAIPLPAIDGSLVDLSALPGRSVVYVYPRTGRPDQPLPTGWNEIPGARGCTPQSCAYRDLAAEFAALGTRIFGLSTQDTAYQQEAAERLHLPFPLLSDERLTFASALGLPTFTVDGMTLIRRLTLVIRHGVIETVFYPVFPPDADAAKVREWLDLRMG